jgi:zinc and cadmium transporter
MPTPWVLVVYSLICIAASLAGGWVPLVMHLTHRRMQVAISFVSGIVLGIGLLHLLPHSVEALGSIDRAVLWVLGGFLFMFFLERFFHFHHHDAPDESAVPAQVTACDQDHDHAHSHSDLRAATPLSWVGVAIGLTLHALIDGVAIAAAVRAEAEHGAILAGIGACLAVALHKPFDALTIGTLMAAAGQSTRSRQLLNAGYSLVTPVGIILFYVVSAGVGHPTGSLGPALGFSAGAFLCIATSDLLPELQFHRHDRVALSIALGAGLVLAWSTVFFESGGHDHHHQPKHSGHVHGDGVEPHAHPHPHSHD